MKILHAVEYYYPSLGGAQEIVRRISEHLIKLGHEVTVATTQIPGRASSEHHGVTIEEFAIHGNYTKGMRGEVDRYRKFVIEGKFDVVMVYAAQQWTTDAILEILPQIPAKKVFVPCGFSGLYRKEYKEYFSLMPDWLRQFDWLVFLSETYRDITFARQHGLLNFSVIPNGAAAEEFDQPRMDFRKKYNLADNFLLLTVGGHTGVKGHTFAMRTFTRANIHNATLVIVGNTPLGGGCKRRCELLAGFFNRLPANTRCHKRIILLDPPRAEVVAAYTAADIFVFPSNIEASPLVLFESMAAGLPFITFDVGNAAEIVDWSKGGIVAKTQMRTNGYSYGQASDFARHIEELYQQPEQRLQLGQAGQAAWKKSFTIESLAQRYADLYQQLLRT